jgi:ribosomal protein S18 acetylase RimI-like enzyme
MSTRRPPHPVYGPTAAPVRLATEADLPLCLAIDDAYTTNRVWQMDLHHPGDPVARGPHTSGTADLDETLEVSFRPIRLPRPLTVPGEAAASPADRLARWRDAAALLVVGPRPVPPPPPPDPEEEESPLLAGRPPMLPLAEVWGYVLLRADPVDGRAWVQTLAVGPAHRQQGLGGRLLEAAKAWTLASAEEGGAGGLSALMIALAPKNYPAITFCRRRGFRFCGYADYTPAGGNLWLYFLCPLRG